MIEPSSYLLFLAACGALIVVPGPAQALVMARTLAEGRRSGALTAVGLNLGTLLHTVAAALGLSAILASSALAFAVVKYMGAAYLIYLGIRVCCKSPSLSPPARARQSCALRSPLVQAVVTGVLNPKVALFFLAFLPQFVDVTRGALFPQFLVLGATMAVLDTSYELILVELVSGMKRQYLSNPRVAAWQNRMSGCVLIGLGLRLAVQER
jgi:threonine/homoserine/homoserine lactone efflux protein